MPSDDIGNRKSTGGRASAVSTYKRDYQNKYSQRTAAGSVDIVGIANPTASVTVNSVAATRKGEYFHRAVAVVNTGGAQYPAITITSAYGATESNPANEEIFVPPSTEAFAHDADGNLTSDGRWTYEWDGENRLHAMRSKVGSPAPERRIEFEYDYLGRRIRQTVWNDRDDLQGSELSDVIYLYDRWNVVGELDANNSKAKLRTYVWGLDLSGTRHGAGGVGGLLKITDYVGGTTHHFAAYDGNGNVLSLNSGTTGATTARYEYGPFGETIRVTGTMAEKNPFRFSTKFTDNESGLVYYGFRYYNPVAGRWLSRDPIAEVGGNNLFAMAANSPINLIDPLGKEVMPSGYPFFEGSPERTVHLGYPDDGVTKVGHYWNVAMISENVNMMDTTFDGAIKRLSEILGDAGCISGLTISGHGSPGSIGGGNQELRLENFDDPKGGQARLFAFIKSRLCKQNDGVTLKSCYQSTDGRGKNFMIEMAKILNTKVVGWDDKYAVGPHGKQHTALPDGSISETGDKGPYKGTVVSWVDEKWDKGTKAVIAAKNAVGGLIRKKK